MRIHARPVLELGTHAVAEKSNPMVRIFAFRGRFLVPLLGPFFGSHFWDRPNQFLFSGPKNWNQKMVPKLGPRFYIFGPPKHEQFSAKNVFRGHVWLRPGTAAGQAVSKGSRGEAPAIAFQKTGHFAQFAAKARRQNTAEPASCDCIEMKLGAPCERAILCNARTKAPATLRKPSPPQNMGVVFGAYFWNRE